MHAFCMNAVTEISYLAFRSKRSTYFLVAAAVSFASLLHASRNRRRKTLQLPYLAEAVVLVPLSRWSRVSKKGLAVALQLRGEVRVVHLDEDHRKDEVLDLWQRNVIEPLHSAGKKIPKLVFLPPSEMHALSPMAGYVLQVEREEPDRQIVVVIPELAVRHWWQKPLHNHRNRFLKWVLFLRGSQRIMVIDVPWYL